MTVEDILDYCDQYGIKLIVEKENIKLSGKKEHVNSVLISHLKRHKSALVTQLLQRDIQALQLTQAPLSRQQYSLWLTEQSAEPMGMYNLARAFRFEGKLNIDALKRAFQTLVTRHAILRTRITHVDGELQQQVGGIDEFDWRVESLYDEKGTRSKQNQLEKTLTEEAEKSFDLQAYIKLRVRLYRLAPNESVLLIVVHHIVSDGWSSDIILREVAHTYMQENNPNEHPIPLAPILAQYTDYADWQRKRLHSDKADQQAVAYYSRLLEDAPPVHNLPLDKPRPARMSFQGRTYTTALPPELAEAADAFCHRYGVTLHVLLQSALFVLLAQWSRESNIVMGTPLANRTRSETRSLIGYFVNMSVMHCDLSHELSVLDFLHNCQDMVSKCLENQDLSFDELLAHLNLKRSLSHHPLFQIVFAFEEHKEVLAFTNGIIEPVPIERTSAKFDLTLTAVKSPGELKTEWEYSTDLFSFSTVSRLASCYQTLLSSMLAAPEQPVMQLALLDKESANIILDTWNNTRQDDIHNNRCLHEEIEGVCVRFAERIAVQFGEQEIHYAELNKTANKLARLLLTKGVKPETPIGIYMDRSIEIVIAVLASLKAGATYIPLDPDYPLQRLKHMYSHSGLELILTHAQRTQAFDEEDEFLSEIDAENVITFSLTTLRDDKVEISSDNIKPQTLGLRPDHLAYIIYTSGSTGKPKGVAIEHRSALNTILDINSRYQVDENDAILCLSSLSFDLSVYDIFGLLSVGGRVVLPENGREKDPAHWLEQLENRAITLWNTVPTSMDMLVEYMIAENKRTDSPLRRVLLSGDWIPPKLPNKIAKSFRHALTTSLGGATEASIWSINYDISREEQFSSSIPYGKPLANQKFYILNPQGNPVPIGVIGELHIAGLGLAREYYNDQFRTQERFINSNVLNERLYLTGDLGRYREDGNIEFIGRIDNQVKLRGFRIELGEIEDSLSAISSVRDCVVLISEIRDSSQATHHDSSSERTSLGKKSNANMCLTAYVVPETNVKSNSDNTVYSPQTFRQMLRKQLESCLPAYMVPSAFVILDCLPLTANGKIDRKGLPKPDSYATIKNDYVAPNNLLQETLCHLWEEVFSLSPIGINDNFFDLGGHSLKAVQLVSRIRQQLSVDLPLKTIFDNPSIAALARVLEAKSDTISQKDAGLPVTTNTHLSGGSIREQGIASYAQQQLWLFEQSQNVAGVYNIPCSIELKGRLDFAALELAIKLIVYRHEPLRTTFQPHHNGVVQKLTIADCPRNIKLNIEYIDLSSLTHEEKEKQLGELKQSEANAAFDLTKDLMLRAKLVHISSQDNLLLLTFHHIATDAWSLTIFFNELTSIYNSLIKDGERALAGKTQTEGIANNLPKLPISYINYALGEHKALKDTATKQSLQYWESYLDALPTLHDLPLDYLRPSQQSYRGGVHVSELNGAQYHEIQQLANDCGASLFMTLQAMWSALIHRYSASTDIVTGYPVANRSHKSLESAIGFFLNTLVLRVDLSDNPNFNQLLEQVKRHCLNAYSHQHVPFDMLVETLKPERSPSYTPLFQLMLVMQDHSVEKLALSQLAHTRVESLYKKSKFDITLEITPCNDKLILRWEYATDLFAPESIEKLASSFNRLAEKVAKQPHTPLNQLTLLSPKEWIDSHADILWLENSLPKTVNTENASVRRLFDRQATKSPLAPALYFENRELRYGELQERSNRLANYLVKRGLQPQDRVGLVLTRSIDMVVAILAVLKAGAAYVPLNPRFPRERLNVLINNANPRVLLSLQTYQDYFHYNAESTETILLDQQCVVEGISQQSKQAPAIDDNADDLAYIIYTSGSTGEPKGVMVSHRNLSHYLSHSLDCYRVGEGISKDKKLPINSVVSTILDFDATVTSIYTALLSGGCAELLAEDGEEIESLAQCIINASSPLLFKLTPAHLQALTYLLTDFTSHIAHWFIIGGEQLPSAVCAQWQAKILPHATYVNEYGPTETTVGCTVEIISPNRRIKTQKDSEVRQGVAIPVGRAIPLTSLFIANDQQSLQPAGAIGELYIGGPGLAHGYLNKPELTRARFVENPFCSSQDKQAGKLYRSGDRVRMGANNKLEFLGRVDQQIKLRGYRIEVAEIEARLEREKAVKHAAVVLKDVNDKEPTPPKLVAYITTTNDDEGIDLAQSLRLSLSRQLPDYMVPQFFVTLAALPTTVNGKIDRNALSQASLPTRELSAQMQASYVAPNTEEEKLLCEIWQKFLAVEAVGIDDNYFALGGDSIQSIQIISQAKQTGIDISISDMFKHQTIRTLLEHKKMADETASSDFSTAISQQACEGEILLFPIQVKFLQDQPTAINHYNQSVLLGVPSDLDESFLKDFIHQLYERHDALRLVFRQDIDDSASPSVTKWYAAFNTLSEIAIEQVLYVHNISLTDKGEIDKKISEISDSYQSSLVPEQGDLIRVVWFKTTENENFVLFIVHHLTIDGVSWRILLEDFVSALGQWKHGEEIKLAPKTASVQQWAQGLQRLAEKDHLDAEREFWIKQLESHDVLEPLQKTPTNIVSSNNYAHTETLDLMFDETQTHALLRRCYIAYNNRPEELLLCALYFALSTLTKTESMRIDMESHGREIEYLGTDVSDTIGWFTSLFPFSLSQPTVKAQTQLNKNLRIEAALKSMKEQLRAVPNGGIGFGILRYMSSDNKVFQHAKDAEVLFNYLGQFDELIDASSDIYLVTEFSSRNIGPDIQRTHKLNINSWVKDKRLNVRIDYCRNLFTRETIREFTSLLEKEIEEVITHCLAKRNTQYSPSDFPLAQVSQSQLDHWSKLYPSLINLYPTTAMQEGLLYHSLLNKTELPEMNNEINRAPELTRGNYVNQLLLTIHGDLSTERLRAAWQKVCDDQEVLRTAFVGMEQRPHQLVVERVDLPWLEKDWVNIPSSEQEKRMSDLVHHDRTVAFDYAKPPLMRFTLIRLAEKKYHLLWTHHHAIIDGWCLALLWQQVLRAYKQKDTRADGIVEKPATFQAYIEWLQKQDIERAKDFWRQSISTIESTRSLGEVFVQSGLAKNNKDVVNSETTFRLNSDNTAALIRYARDKKITLNILVQAAWAYLLSWYTGEDSVIFGETVAGRPAELPGVEKIIGLMINTLPVCVNVGANTNLENWVKQLHKQSIERSQHGYMPLADIQKLSTLPVNTPLFDTLIVFENYPISAAANRNNTQLDDDINVVAIESFEQTHYDLTLTVVPGDVLTFKLNRNIQKYTQEDAHAMLCHLNRILLGFTDASVTVLRELPTLSKDEQETLVKKRNNTNTTFKGEIEESSLLHQLFEAQVEKTPNSVACILAEQSLTYDALNQRSNQLANFLLEQGIQCGTPVGICMRRSLDMLIATLGVLKSGGSYVPIDPSIPAERKQYIADDSAMKVLLCHHADLDKMPELSTKIIAVDRPCTLQRIQDHSSNSVDITKLGVTGDSLAYIIYTSGSTGKPKGVGVEHRNVINFIYSMTELVDYTPVSSWLAVTSLSFDISVMELFWPLCVGLRTVIQGDDPGSLSILEHMRKYNITHFQCTPSLLSTLVNDVTFEESVSLLSHLLVGGEAFPPHLLDTLREQYNGRILNMYGPTETTIWSTAQELSKKRGLGASTIGLPLGNTQVYVLNARGQLVPDGVCGELHISGAGVTRGYVNKTDLTEKSFIDNPFLRNERMYRTGDVVRWSNDGRLEFVARVDNQVKVRGHRVELGEIEYVLSRLPEVEEACVVTVTSQDTTTQLVAYVIADKSRDEEERDFSQRLLVELRIHLPEYMIPSGLVFLKQFPLTVSGKLDRRALPDANFNQSIDDDEFKEPSNQLEKDILSSWKALLQLKSISVNRSFFQIGGDSLLATRFILSIQKTYDIDVTIRDFMSNNSIATFAKLIEDKMLKQRYERTTAEPKSKNEKQQEKRLVL